MMAATRSKAECAASEMMPKLPVVTPTITFNIVMNTAAITEFSATLRFSRLIIESEVAPVGCRFIGVASMPAAIIAPSPPSPDKRNRRLCYDFCDPISWSPHLMIRIFSVFLLSSVLLAQTPAPAKPADTSGPPAAKAAGASGPAAAKSANTSDPAAVRMTDPVMVIPGVCDHPPAAKSATAPCETRITRQQFETLWNTFSRQAARPGAQKPVVEEPAQARKAMATAYSSMAVMSQQATKEGLDRTPEFQLQLKVLKMQLLAKQLQQKIKND